MKSQKRFSALGFAGATLFVTSIAAMSGQTDKASPEPEVVARVETGAATAKDSEKKIDTQALQRALDLASSEVRRRLGMPAMLEVSGDPGEEDEIMELYRSGWIVEATIEEVEAAKKAAATTPELEDDIAAQTLAHRASCRFFYKE